MATTVSINSDQSIKVTTFYGGMKRGRCYNFHTNNRSAVVTEKQLLTLIDLISQNGETA